MRSNKESAGLGLGGVLFIVFLVLKLTGNIDWSWWWVCSPLWIGFLLFIFTFIIATMVIVKMEKH